MSVYGFRSKIWLKTELNMLSQTSIKRILVAVAFAVTAALPFTSSAKQPAIPVTPCESCADYTPGMIVLPAAWAADPAISTAAAELAAEMGAIYGKTPSIVSDSRLQAESAAESFVIVGGDNGYIEQLSLSSLKYKDLVPDEAYSIATGKTYDARPALLIQGGDIRGCVNGIYFLAEQLLLSYRRRSALNIIFA